ncbi:MAG: TonB-dependent receptor, partial [Deltaproteobacteria bacterium]|nr:TonB-dependent receptor [Deltaproteobacteria bacterium]
PASAENHDTAAEPADAAEAASPEATPSTTPSAVPSTVPSATPNTTPSVSARPSDEVMDEIRIVYPPPAERTATIPAEAFESGRARNVSEGLTEIPGLSGVKRGANGVEPVVRGLGWERVPIQVQGLPVSGAGPGRMDTPATFFGPSAIQKVEVVKGLPSVVIGPGGTGGHVNISTDFERPADSGIEVGGRVLTTYQGDRHAFSGLALGQGGSDRFDLHMGVEGSTGGAYHSANGTRVPNENNAVGGNVSMGFRPAEGHRIFGGFVGTSYWDTDFPSQPMDAAEGDSYLGNLGWRLDREEGTLEQLIVRGGYNAAYHQMSNARRPASLTMLAVTNGDADTGYGAVESHWRLPADIGLAAGVDFNHLQRNAIRDRTMVMNGMQLRDFLWPDIYQWTAGFYGEIDFDITPELTLRAGGRLDVVRADARAADAPSADPGLSVREAYVVYYGPDAAKTDRTNTLGSGNLLLEWQPRGDLTTHAGAGVISRAPSSTERYFAFAPARGGYTIGDPSLDPEMRVESEAGIGWKSEYVDTSLLGFYSWFPDYILPTQVGTFDDDLPVRGYENIEAQTWGIEASIKARWGKHLRLPLSFSYVEGRNLSGGGHLPQMPPFAIRAALRWEDYSSRAPWWVQFGGQFVRKQDLIDPDFPENETPGWENLHVRGSVEVFPGLIVEAGVENLLDQEYSRHLTIPAAQATGDLSPGQEIPEPGRYGYVSLNWIF